MPNYGIIIVDNMESAGNLPKKEYANLRNYFVSKYPKASADEIEVYLAEALECFDSALRITTLSAGLFTTLFSLNYIFWIK